MEASRSSDTGTAVRGVTVQDVPALREICRLTGDSGGDASALTAFPDLLGDVYAAPYAHHEAAFGSVVVDGDGPAGYVLGCRDTAVFEQWREEHWWPGLRRRLPPADAFAGRFDEWLLGIVHAGVTPEPVWSTHPSHLHIDLLPRVQGRGFGRRLIERVCAQLAAAGSPGVHLGVSARNPGAVEFYRRTGFVELSRTPHAHTFGRELSSTGPSTGAS